MKVVKIYNHKTKLMFFVGLFSLFVSGCIDLVQHVTIYNNEEWKLEASLTVPIDTLGLFGGEESFENELDLPEDGSGEEDGVKTRWSKKTEDDGSVKYSVEAEGDSFETLNDYVFGGSADIDVNRDDEITITFFPDTIQLEGYEMHISGGKIISSNADEESNDTASWYDPTGKIEVELTPKGSSNLYLIIVIMLACLCFGFLIAAAGGGGYYFYNRQKKLKEAEE